MRQLMSQQRREKKQRRQQGRGPNHAWTPLRMALLELRRERHGDQQRNQEPTVMQTNFDAEHATKWNAGFHALPLRCLDYSRGGFVAEDRSNGPLGYLVA